VIAQFGETRESAIERDVHDDRTASILGIALGVAFATCFVTGLTSHLIQHPPSWFDWPTRPVGLYRITQGVHVATGIAAVPLLFAKLWAVYPRLFRAPRRDVGDILARITLVPLVGGSLFMLATGVGNVERWYPWPFFFPRAHFWVAWITVGALVVHVGAQISTTRAALRRSEPPAEAAADDPRGMSRRGFLWSVVAASGALTIVTIGQTFSPLRRFVLFAQRRPDIGTQGLPVNQSAVDAHVVSAARHPDYRLTVEEHGETKKSWTVAELETMPRHTATLPIACVEGWSASAQWSGVRVRDLLGAAGIVSLGSRTVAVSSLEPGGLYSQSHLTANQAHDADTMLALTLNGERLNLDHGFPTRLIAPNRPGVMQTKWVTKLVVG